jgi:hypothetical protein
MSFLCEAGRNVLNQPWTVFPLLVDESKQFVELLKADELVWNFVQAKLLCGQ